VKPDLARTARQVHTNPLANLTGVGGFISDQHKEKAQRHCNFAEDEYEERHR